jgi:hypothetical protein
VSYGVENALFQWEDGERRVRAAEPPVGPAAERATQVVLGELRKRLGSSYTVEELAELYAAGVDWAADLARTAGAGSAAVAAVDAAFARYARGATNFGGGRRRRAGGE